MAVTQYEVESDLGPSSTFQDDEKLDRYPTVTIYWSMRKAVLPLTTLIALTIFSGSIVFGFISSNDEIIPYVAMLCFLLCNFALLCLIYQSINWNLTRPAIIIDKLGFLESRYVSELIPWNCVAEISSKTRRFGRGKELQLIEVLLKADVPPSLESQIKRKRWMNFRDGSVITITDGLIAASHSQLYILFLMYFEEFGEMSKSAVGLSDQTDCSSDI